MYSFWTRFRKFMYFHRKERNGIIVMISILLIFYTSVYLYDKFYKVPKHDIYRFLATVDSIEAALKSSIKEPRYFAFNPNVADSSTLASLGFTAKQVNNLINYRKAGAVFRKKEDFKRLYFVDDSIYSLYEPYILINNLPKKIRKDLQFRNSIKEKATSKKSIYLFKFDPNKLSLYGWDSLGVSKKVASNIKKYITKGGKFRRSEDLKKIYGLTEAKYKEILPYVDIPKNIKKSKTSIEDKRTLLNINTATWQDLKKIHIGKYTISKLLKYRKRMGGFVSMAQFKEVRNMPQRDYDILLNRVKISGEVHKININKATLKELYSHPYIDYRMAKDIIRYRDRKGGYTNLEKILEKKIIPTKVFHKVKYYLFVKK